MRQVIDKFSQRLGPLWWHTLLMFVSSKMGDVINMYIALFVVPDVLDHEDLGAVVPIVRLVAVLSVPLSIILSTSLKYLSLFHVQGASGRVKALVLDLSKFISVLSTLILLFLIVFRDFIEVRLKISDEKILWVVAAMALMSCWKPTVEMAAQGTKRFYALILSQFFGPVVRLLAILAFLDSLQLAGYLLATVLADLSICALLVWSFYVCIKPTIVRESYSEFFPSIRKYLLPIGLVVLLTSIQTMIEPWIIRQRLSEADSAGFYMATTLGSIPMYFSNAMIPFFFVLISENYERGLSTRKLHLQALGVVLVLGLSVSGVFLVFHQEILGLRPSWSTFSEYGPYVGLLGIIMTGDILLRCHYLHENACHRFRYLWYYTFFIVLEVSLLYGLNLWTHVQDFFANSTWLWVQENMVSSLKFTVYFMLLTRVLIAFGIAIELIFFRFDGVRPSVSEASVR